MSESEIQAAMRAISRAWGEFGEVPFPLYESELRALAEAAVGAVYEVRNANA